MRSEGYQASLRNGAIARAASSRGGSTLVSGRGLLAHFVLCDFSGLAELSAASLAPAGRERRPLPRATMACHVRKKGRGPSSNPGAREGMPTELPKDTIVDTGVGALIAEEPCECRRRLKPSGVPLHFRAEEGMGR